MSNWQRIDSIGIDCVVCRKPDWCLASPDGVICGRTKMCDLPTCRYCRSGKPRRAGSAGYLHIVRIDSTKRRCRTTRFRIVDSQSFKSRHREYQNSIEPSQFDWLARQLNVNSSALRQIELGWCHATLRFTFPIRRPTGQIVGIATRSITGKKKHLYGSASGQGLFIPGRLQPEKALFIPEGASDTASLLSLGLNAVGRTSVTTAHDLVGQFAVLRGFRHVIAVADNDEHERGQRAAAALAQYLKPFRCWPYLLIPPEKDVRQWIALGATIRDIRERIQRV